MKLIKKPILFSTIRIQHAFGIESLALKGKEVGRTKAFDDILLQEFNEAIENFNSEEIALFKIVRQSMRTEIIDFN